MRLSKNPLFSIFLIILVDVLGLTLILPLLPFYAERLGATPALVGLLASTYAVCQLVAGPVLGRLSDRIGRKPVLLVSQAGTLAGFILLAYSRTLFWVFASRALDGITAGNISVAQAYISDVVPPQGRARAFGLVGVAFGMGFMLGPAISGLLAAHDYRWPMFGAAALSATSILATALLLPKGAPEAQPKVHAQPRASALSSTFEALREPTLKPLLAAFFAFCVAFSVYVSGLALFSERKLTWHGHPFGAREVGYLYGYGGLVGVLIQAFVITRLVQKLGQKRLAALGFCSMAIAYFSIGLTSWIPAILFAITLSSFGNSVIRPSLTSLVTANARPDRRGLTLGVLQSLMSVAQITAPLLAGAWIEKGFLMAWAFTASIAALAGARLMARAGDQ